ncbi:MAG: cysteine--tRNA ligase [Acidimicrobiia bacterium]
MRIYSTLAREKVEFLPREEGKVAMYVCGPTVYDAPHLGHARSALSFDVIRRYLEYRGYDVSFVMNYTDVDDKIIQRASTEGVTAKEIANRYIEVWNESMAALGIERPTIAPRATEHIDGMIEMISELVKSGHAYAVEGDVYFSIETYPRYGELSGKNIEELRAGARVEPGENKRHPLDFALWKSFEGDPSWDSPWGKGRPGWHIECSVMSLRFLGDGFDIHGGGQDLVFPHHENERAQAEAAGHTFARVWMHAGLVNLGGEKMAKSTGNYVTLAEALTRHRPEAFRMLTLRSHYRSPLDFGADQIEQAEAALARIEDFYFRASSATTSHESKSETHDVPPRIRSQIDSYRKAFTSAMDDDFNTPAALAVVFEVIKAGNHDINSGSGHSVKEAYASLVSELLSSVGLDLDPTSARSTSHRADISDRLVETVLELRESLRAARMFDLADKARARLEELGVSVEDTPSGPRWRWSRGD